VSSCLSWEERWKKRGGGWKIESNRI
jgi:hypothetical protein